MGIVEATVTNKGKKGLIRRFAPYFKKYLWILIFDLFCAALTTVCELALPIIVQQITDRGINDLASLTLSYILRIGGLYIFLKLVDVGATFFMASIGHIMGTKIETDMRRDMFAHLQKLSFSYFDNTKIGQLMSRITTDLFDITEFAHHCPEEFFIAGIKIIGAFVILCTMSVPLTLIIFAVLPFMLAAAMFFNKRMQAQFRSQRQQLGEINAQVEDSLLGVRVVKSFANEPLEEKKFEEGNQRFYNIKRLRYMYMGGFEASNRLFDGLMNLLVLVAGALFMINGQIEPADLVAYMLYVGTLITSIRRLVQFAEQFQRINEHFARTFTRLFGGGTAKLQLQDEKNVLTCGIDIVAQPPGKKLQLLSLLSGGERALTAIAILFAMLEIRPSPFCILDEIEAALDEANVANFADYLKQYSRDTQFIVITHRKGTMERCDALYGVAMEEKGVSRMVSVQLRDLEEQLEEESHDGE